MIPNCWRRIRPWRAPCWPQERLQYERRRSHLPKQQSLFQLFRRLVDFEDLVGPNRAQHLDYATWPANLNAIDLVELASSEVDTSRTGGSIAHRRGHVVELIA